jgi:hypothetical protein
MFTRTSVRNVVLSLVVYGLIVCLWAGFQANELMSRAQCCGLYGYYETHYYPFPSMSSSKLSHWGGGPAKVNPIGVLLNILIPLMIASIAWILSRHPNSQSDVLSD